MNRWPLQREADQFYGNPRGKNGKADPAWEKANLVQFLPPWQMFYDGKPLTRGFRIHRLCHDSLARVFAEIAQAAHHMPNVIAQWGMDTFSGSYNYRPIRGSSHLSMHAYGCAIDLDARDNAMGDLTPEFATHPVVLAAFDKEGWVWGGRWTGRPDAMHWQAARV